jgi:hypothetical protein
MELVTKLAEYIVPAIFALLASTFGRLPDRGECLDVVGENLIQIRDIPQPGAFNNTTSARKC